MQGPRKSWGGAVPQDLLPRWGLTACADARRTGDENRSVVMAFAKAPDTEVTGTRGAARVHTPSAREQMPGAEPPAAAKHR